MSCKKKLWLLELPVELKIWIELIPVIDYTWRKWALETVRCVEQIINVVGCQKDFPVGGIKL